MRTKVERRKPWPTEPTRDDLADLFRAGGESRAAAEARQKIGDSRRGFGSSRWAGSG